MHLIISFEIDYYKRDESQAEKYIRMKSKPEHAH